MDFAKSLLGHYTQTFRVKNIIYLKNAEVVYFVIPKSGNTSIRHFLLPLVDSSLIENRYTNISQEVDWTYITPNQFLKIKSRVHSFSVTRNPVDRFYATFKAKIRNKVPPPFAKLGFQPNMTLMDFTKLACALSDHDTEYHLKSQYFLTHSLGKILPSNIYDISELDKVSEGLKTWLSDRNIRTKDNIEHLNPNNSKIKNVSIEDRIRSEFEGSQEYDHFQSLIFKRYEMDFKLPHIKYA